MHTTGKFESIKDIILPTIFNTTASNNHAGEENTQYRKECGQKFTGYILTIVIKHGSRTYIVYAVEKFNWFPF